MTRVSGQVGRPRAHRTRSRPRVETTRWSRGRSLSCGRSGGPKGKRGGRKGRSPRPGCPVSASRVGGQPSAREQDRTGNRRLYLLERGGLERGGRAARDSITPTPVGYVGHRLFFLHWGGDDVSFGMPLLGEQFYCCAMRSRGSEARGCAPRVGDTAETLDASSSRSVPNTFVCSAGDAGKRADRVAGPNVSARE